MNNENHEMTFQLLYLNALKEFLSGQDTTVNSRHIRQKQLLGIQEVRNC